MLCPKCFKWTHNREVHDDRLIHRNLLAGVLLEVIILYYFGYFLRDITGNLSKTPFKLRIFIKRHMLKTNQSTVMQ